MPALLRPRRPRQPGPEETQTPQSLRYGSPPAFVRVSLDEAKSSFADELSALSEALQAMLLALPRGPLSDAEPQQRAAHHYFSFVAVIVVYIFLKKVSKLKK